MRWIPRVDRSWKETPPHANLCLHVVYLQACTSSGNLTGGAVERSWKSLIIMAQSWSVKVVGMTRDFHIRPVVITHVLPAIEMYARPVLRRIPWTFGRLWLPLFSADWLIELPPPTKTAFPAALALTCFTPHSCGDADGNYLTVGMWKKRHKFRFAILTR